MNDGKVQQWYARTDGSGVVFILNCATVIEAQALMNSLPLAKANLATFEYVPFGPLTPLRMPLAALAPPKTIATHDVVAARPPQLLNRRRDSYVRARAHDRYHAS